MSVLDRKLVRDLRRLAPQVAAIALLGGIGVAVAVMANGALTAVVVAQQRYYARTHFADVFASAVRAPRSLAAALRRIDGVVAVDTRATGGGLLDAPGLDRPAHVELISLPPEGVAALNRLVLAAGRMPAPGRSNEAVALKAFLDAAHVSLGARLTATISGREVTFTIVGAVLSPEYVYSPSESFLPDDAHQAVFWANRDIVEGVTGEVGAFDQVSLELSGDTDPVRVLPQVDRLLAPYGGAPAVTRANQPSNRFLDNEERQLRTLTLMLPPIFLLVAAGLTHMVMARLVETEREQIGLLKAFGFTALEVAVPYLRLAAVIGLIGVIAGGVAGVALAAALTRLYAQYFRFPAFEPQIDWGVYGATSLMAMAAAVAGAGLAAGRAAQLRPAAAMQPAPPVAYRRGLLSGARLGGFLDQPTRMIVRRIGRFPARAALTVGGLALSLTLLVSTQFLRDSLDQVIDRAYYRAQRWSAELTFFHPRDARAVTEAARLPGVIDAEPIRAVMAWAVGPAGRKQIAIMGLGPQAVLARALDAGGRPIAFAGDGVTLSAALAERLDLRLGDKVELDTLEGRRPRLLLPLTGLADDYSGLYAYMDRRELNRLMGDGDLASGVNLLTASDQTAGLYAAVERRPQIIGAVSRDAMVSNWRAQIARSFSTSILFYLFFSGAIAIGVSYNMGRITLAERSRDLATLQVLGFTRGECAYILYGELGLLAFAAAPLGMALGIAFSHALAAAFAQEELRIPVTISARTMAFAVTAYGASVAVGCLMLQRQLWRLDLVAVLKTRE